MKSKSEFWFVVSKALTGMFLPLRLSGQTGSSCFAVVIDLGILANPRKES